MYSPIGNGDSTVMDSPACPSNSGSDSSLWWDAFVHYFDEQQCPFNCYGDQVSSGSVADAISGDTRSRINLILMAEQELTNSLPSFEPSPMSLDLSEVSTFITDFERQTNIQNMGSDGNCSNEVPDLESSARDYWNFVRSSSSSSTSHSSDHDSRDDHMGTTSNSSPSESNLSPEMPENHKVMIPKCSLFTCPHCNATYTSESRLSSHTQKCSKSNRHQCESCFRNFSSEKDKRRHQESVHSVEKKFACTCGKRYSRPDGLKRHINGKKDDAAHHQMAV